VRRLTVPTCAACAALLIAACGGSSKHASTAHRPANAKHASAQTQTPTPTGTITDATSTIATETSTTPPPSPAAIEKAATLTADEPGFRARISADIKLPQFNGNPLTARGDGYFDPGSSSGTLDVAVELPGLLGLAGPIPTQVRVVGGEAYAQLPSDVASEISSHYSWLETSIAALDLGDSLDPAEILSDTARDATEDVPDQRASVTIDAATGLIRTIVLNYSEPGGYHVYVRLLLIGFGAQPATAAPPASETGSLQSALQALGF
jgi:hypothetical protein